MAQTTPTTPLFARLWQVVDANHGTARGLIRGMLAQLEYVLGRLENHTHPPAHQMERLVIMCLGNINRSAFAEHVAHALGANTCSIGLSTTTGVPAYCKAVETARQFGLDLSQHQATDLKDYSYQPTDLLLTMEIRHARQLMEINGRYWGSYPLAVHCHADFALISYYLEIGFGLPTLRTLRTLRPGFRCRMMSTEIKRLFRLFLHPELIVDRSFKIRRWAEGVWFVAYFFRPRVGYYVCDGNDPKPFFADVMNLFQKRLKRLQLKDMSDKNPQQ